MLRALGKLLARSLVEVALIFLAVAGVLGLLAWKVCRRLVTDEPDRLELAAARVMRLLELGAVGARLRGGIDSAEAELELEELEQELEEELEHDDWRRMVV